MLDRISAALSRRNLLLGLAASATAASVADAATSPQENPELLSLADALPAVLAEYVAARDKVRAIVAEWSPQWPIPSEQIICFGQGCKDYRGLDGRGIELPWGKNVIKRMQQVGTPEVFEAAAKHHETEVARIIAKGGKRNLKYHRVWAAREKAAVEPARAFWAEVDRITAASGIEAAQRREVEAVKALVQAVDRVMATDDWTITGAVIKAQALGAWGGLDRHIRLLSMRDGDWSQSLAASILKHAA
jgi:hypothetical protein